MSLALCTWQELFKSGQFAEAVAKYSDAISVVSDSAVLYTNRSLANFKAGQLEEAASDARKAVELDPRAGKGYVRLGDALTSTSKDEAKAARKSQHLNRSTKC